MESRARKKEGRREMNKWVVALLVVTAGACGYAEDSSNVSRCDNNYSSNNSQGYGYGYERRSEQDQGSNQRSPSPYSSKKRTPSYNSPHQNSGHLTAQEAKFANWLSPLHRRVFTEMFTPMMRSSAMQLASFRFYDMEGPAGSISPDQSVELVMSKSRRPIERNRPSPKSPYQGQEAYRSYAPTQREGGRRSYSNPNARSNKEENSDRSHGQTRVSPYSNN
ncbi:hypothetical protein COB21_02480 [Candidatus Aerophobetes bacterium]|uniref:Uncharacterized protein n=1 Tax=Aerophobetes bacterium TaxID=2030807 RepID=A0A2A4X6U2_UNCAE|nr:MAG: hypothetical protein COB21_02480 [Candidatus Aerophobetes bacterium]